MLSAAGFPIVMFGPVHLPPILPHSTRAYVALRESHTVLAYLLFVAFMAHLTAVLFHTLVLRDGLLQRMAPITRPRRLRYPWRAHAHESREARKAWARQKSPPNSSATESSTASKGSARITSPTPASSTRR